MHTDINAAFSALWTLETSAFTVISDLIPCAEVINSYTFTGETIGVSVSFTATNPH
jgi:hypothetical protein